MKTCMRSNAAKHLILGGVFLLMSGFSGEVSPISGAEEPVMANSENVPQPAPTESTPQPRVLMSPSAQNRPTRYSRQEPPQTPAAATTPQFISDSGDVKGMKITRDRISLDLKGIDINELFRILSLKMGITIVPSRSVTGRVNIFLNNVTLQDALDIILISQDLAADRRDNIITVMTAPEYERLYGKRYNEKRKFKNIKISYAKPATVFNALGQIKSDIGKIIVDESSGNIFLIDVPEKLELMERTVKDMDQPLAIEVFDLKYAKSSDMKTQLSSAITQGAGEVLVDEKSGKVVVTDLPGKMKKIKKIVNAFDSEPLQVFIQAEIIQVTLNDQYQRGVNWEKIFSEWNKKKLGLNRLGLLSAVVDIAGSYPLASIGAVSQKVTLGTMAVNNYTVVLNYLETMGDTKILSRPQIAAVNNQEAKILVGTREAYVSQTLSQAQTTTVTSESVQFVDVGVKLNVVPSINRDGYVVMKIKPEVSSVSRTITTALGSIIPIVDTAEAETVVKVREGTMIMIAGLMKDEKKDTKLGLPILGKLPLIGAFFSNRDFQKKRTEIMVFLTPYIISGDAPVAGKTATEYIPPDMASPGLRDHLVAKNIESIDVSPIFDEKKAGRIEAPQPKVKSEINIQEKMKGLKGL